MATALLLTTSCDRFPVTHATSPQAKAVTLTVSAAASLQDVMKAIQAVYRQEHPHTNLVYNFGSSGSLQQQIEQGAPVDVFFSAAQQQMNALEQQELLLPGTRQNLVGNQVVLVAPKNSDIADFQDLIKDSVQRTAIGDPRSVPAGQYAQEVLISLKLYEALKPKLVFARDVRQVLTYVETGNADAGLVYATDARSERVRVVATAPPNTHQPILYPVAVIKASKNAEAAQEFVQFLVSDRAQAIFSQYGFISVNQ